MEVRKARESLRAALTLAKEFCKMFGAENLIRDHRQITTQLRNEIMDHRRADLMEYMNKPEEEKKMTPEWYNKLRNDLLSSKHHRGSHYDKYFNFSN